jgi:hypothetical protein
MTTSLIHAAFDPLPPILFSTAALAAGLLLEMRWALAPLLGRIRDLVSSVARLISRICSRQPGAENRQALGSVDSFPTQWSE